MRVCLRILTACVCAFSFFSTQAQPVTSGGPDTSAASMDPVRMYHNYIGAGSRLYSGKQYLGYFRLAGNAYFLADTAQQASVVFEGLWYRDFAFLYDLIQDRLVVRDNQGALIEVPERKVKEFLFLGHRFIRGPGGYEDLLCSGALTLVAKRKKKIEESLEGGVLTRTVVSDDHFFVLKGNVRYPIDRLHSLLLLTGDKKKEITRELHNRHLQFKKQPEQTLIEAVNYYDQSYHS